MISLTLWFIIIFTGLFIFTFFLHCREVNRINQADAEYIEFIDIKAKKMISDLQKELYEIEHRAVLLSKPKTTYQLADDTNVSILDVIASAEKDAEKYT